MSADQKHYLINATVFKERVEELHYISDPSKNIRRQESKSTWHIEQLLGRGASGEVKLQRNKETSKVRAVKRITTPEKVLSTSEWEKELEALIQFSKPKFRDEAVFIEFYGWFRDGSDVFLAMEFVELGDLETNVKARSGRVSEAEARDIAEQILFGLEIMHAEKFAHRDLKPQNILVVSTSPKWWIKLADFGLSKKLIDATNYTQCGTPSYMAPEILNLYIRNPEMDYTNAIDIWAVGCIIYRLVVGVVPFPPGFALIEFCAYKTIFPQGHLVDVKTSAEFDLFLRKLIVLLPEERFSAAQALQHPWIKSGSASGGNSDSKLPEASAVGDAFSGLAISDTGYDTVSHPGLKSEVENSSEHALHKMQISPGPSSIPNQLSDHPSETSYVQAPLPAGNTRNQPAATQSLFAQSGALGSDQSSQSINTSSKSYEDFATKKTTTSLITAVLSQDPNVILQRIVDGADVEAYDSTGWTALHNACWMQGSYYNVEILLRNGADPDAVERRPQGRTPMMIALDANSVFTVDLLMEMGADINVTDAGGMTILHWAVKKGYIETVEKLLKEGANAEAIDRNGATPLDLARGLRLRGPQMVAAIEGYFSKKRQAIIDAENEAKAQAEYQRLAGKREQQTAERIRNAQLANERQAAAERQRQRQPSPPPKKSRFSKLFRS